MGNNEPAVDQSDLKILDSYGLNLFIYFHNVTVYAEYLCCTQEPTSCSKNSF